jgi:LuxR family transcriptional regulator, maltose regulon positive regulatory protein
MMNFASQELSEWRESNNYYEFTPPDAEKKPVIKVDSVKLFADKLRVPPVAEPIARPRLMEHLEKSLSQFSATLIAGRAGTGKTALAADFARQSECCVAWYKVDTSDSDWKVFSRYLSASFNLNCSNENFPENSPIEISATSESLAAQFVQTAGEKPVLIVLDDLHSIFDADWFGEFFNSFVPLLAPNVRLLLIARTLPPLQQLWRLRSKQILGVIDEKLLSFTQDETIELFRKHRLSPSAARSAHKTSYGKIARLEEIIEKKTAKLHRVSV